MSYPTRQSYSGSDSRWLDLRNTKAISGAGHGALVFASKVAVIRSQARRKPVNFTAAVGSSATRVELSHRDDQQQRQGLDARVDRDPGFFVGIKVQRL